MQIQDTRAVITGGVSGLGLAVAQRLVAGGAKVALLDINDDKGAAAVAELGAANARYFRTDVTDEANVAGNLMAALRPPMNACADAMLAATPASSVTSVRK